MLSLTALLALTAAALAAPEPKPTNDPNQVLPPGYVAPWSWFVSGWEASCAQSGCNYDFNLTVPSNKGQPRSGFFYCNGYENEPYGLDNYFAACEALGDAEGLTAAARFRRRQNDDLPRVFEVSVLVPGEGNEVYPYNFTAYGPVVYNRNVAPPTAFDLQPTVWQQLPYPGAGN